MDLGDAADMSTIPVCGGTVMTVALNAALRGMEKTK